MNRLLAVPHPTFRLPSLAAAALIGLAGTIDFGTCQEAAASKPDSATGDQPGTAPEKPSQFTKNESRSVLALGVLDSKIDGGGLPSEVQKLADEGALASVKKNWKEAREAYLKMVRAAPKNALAYANLGIVEYRLQNYDAARAALNRSLQLNPSISQNWLTLGLTYHKEGNLELAISSLARALHQDPDDPRTHLYMAIVVHDYGWGSAAETELLRAIQLDPTYTDAHFNLALMYLEKEPPAVELARRHYYYAIDLGAEPDAGIEKQLKFESGPSGEPPAKDANSRP